MQRHCAKSAVHVALAGSGPDARTGARVPAFQVTEAPGPVALPGSVKRRSRKAAGTIEIDLGSGRRVKVGADVDAAALARVLDVLERR